MKTSIENQWVNLYFDISWLFKEPFVKIKIWLHLPLLPPIFDSEPWSGRPVKCFLRSIWPHHFHPQKPLDIRRILWFLLINTVNDTWPKSWMTLRQGGQWPHSLKQSLRFFFSLQSALHSQAHPMPCRSISTWLPATIQRDTAAVRRLPQRPLSARQMQGSIHGCSYQTHFSPMSSRGNGTPRTIRFINRILTLRA